MIYHFLTVEDGRAAQERASYAPQSLETDGFIHCCTLDQIDGMVKRLSPNGSELLLLQIDEGLSEAFIRSNE